MDWLTGLLSSAVASAVGTVQAGVSANVAGVIDQYRANGARLQQFADRIAALRATPRGRNDLDYGRDVSQLDATVASLRQQQQTAIARLDELVNEAGNVSLNNLVDAAPAFASALAAARAVAGSVASLDARVVALERQAGPAAAPRAAVPTFVVAAGIAVVALVILNRRK